eukprot:jgi/Botrbrau1/7055/Bobra.0165s0078.1
MMHLIWLLCLLVSLRSSLAMDWSVCEGVDPKSISAVTLKPDPPSPGVTVDFAIKGTSGLELTNGTLELDVYFHGLLIYYETQDLCKDTTCPVKKGPYEIHVAQNFPPITPPGTYVVKMIGSAGDEEQLLCLIVEFNVVPPSVLGQRESSLQDNPPQGLGAIAPQQ